MKNKLLFILLIVFFFEVKSETRKTQFGLQYKPLIPSKYFNSSFLNETSGNYSFNLTPKYSNSFGMIIRHQVSKNFTLESAINYTQRNYKMSIDNNYEVISDITYFGIRSYEIPIQVLTYVRISELLYLNVAFGISHNVLSSDVLSFGEKSVAYFQNTYRKNGGYRALLSNIGIEFRTNNKGYYYFGASLHRPMTEIARVYPHYNNNDHDFNNVNFDKKIFLEILGNYITLDFRYFFKVN